MKHAFYPNAIARIRGGIHNAQLNGIIRFFQRDDGLIIEIDVLGLPKTDTNFFAFHIHNGDSCIGEGFPGSGSHFNPAGSIHPDHAGDLPPLLGAHGKAYMKVFTDRFHIEEVIGRTVIIHSDPDDFHTQPSGNAGSKIACGVIQRYPYGKASACNV